jgi:hypothetical protein
MESINTNKDLQYQELKKETQGKIHISFSEFSKYQECGHRHLIEKYLQLVEDEPSIHLIFGNSIHKAIEVGIKELSTLEQRIMVFKEEFFREMHNKMWEHPDRVYYEDFLKQGEHIISYLSTESILKKYEIIGVEFVLYEHLFGNFYFKGFIDLIVRDRKTGRYVIIDWKTSGEPWDVNKKKKDEIFLAQMRLYKFFFARKNNIPLEDIDCKYVVLNRLKNKKNPELGLGEIQPVEIYSDENDIKESLLKLASTLKKIHIDNVFLKAKLNGKEKNCKFCPFKSNSFYCNDISNQYVSLLEQYVTEKRIL